MRYRILKTDTVSFLFVVVAFSMALTPFLAEFGQRLGKKFERGDMKVCYFPKNVLTKQSLLMLHIRVIIID